MKARILPLVFLCVYAFAKAQVGIGTTTPQATLDIVASDTAAPSNEDGLLIPRIDDFPATNPTATQDGMMVFVTGNGTPTKGFYYWDNTTVTWVGVSGASGGANTLDQAYDQGGAGAGKNIDANNGAVRIDGTDGLIVTGIQGSGNTMDTEITGAGTRLFFNPRKGSFRAGSVLGSEWDDINIGINSTAIGNSTTASGALSFAQGSNTIASGFGAVSFGLFSISSNTYSLATGQSTIASGVNSATFGRNTRAPSYAEMAIGSFPRIYSATGVSVIDLTDRAFVIGNGTGAGTLSHNAFEIWKNGRVEINEQYSLPITDGTTGQVLTTDGAGQLSFQTVATGGTDTDDQTIDVLNLSGTTLEISLEDDGVATQTVDLSSLSGTERINDLLDGKSDNDGTQDGSSIFLGENAGNADNSTDNRNIGIGFQSLNTNITGQNNVAIGYESLENNRGSNNIGVGNLTLNSAVATGFRNIAIGHNAQVATTTGDDNIAIGDNAMVSNTLARFNVAIGTRALTATTISGQNTAIGHESLTANTGGTNTAVGYESLNANTIGIDNVALGHQAGLGNTGDANVFIGKSAGAQETSANNILYIENSNANADNALIYGEFDNDILRTNAEFQINNPAITGYAFPTADGTANQILTTNGTGQLSFQTVTGDGTGTDDQQIDVLNLNGSTLEISLEDDGVTTQTLDLSSLSGGAGDITTVTAGDGLTGGGTTGTVTLTAAANNGLTVDAAQDRIQLGGPLTEGTTIIHGINRFTHNLNSTGDFFIEDNGTPRFAVQDNGRTSIGGTNTAGIFNVTGNSYFSDDIYLRDGAVDSGDILVRISDAGDAGTIELYDDNQVNHRIRGFGGIVFNELGTGGNFRVESANNPNMINLVSTQDRVGIGTSPVRDFHVAGTTRFSDLAGTGDRMVVANAFGDLSTQAIGGNTLNQAYNQNGAGAGRTIIANSGDVRILGDYGLFVEKTANEPYAGHFRHTSDVNEAAIFAEVTSSYNLQDRAAIKTANALSDMEVEVNTFRSGEGDFGVLVTGEDTDILGDTAFKADVNMSLTANFGGETKVFDSDVLYNGGAAHSISGYYATIDGTGAATKYGQNILIPASAGGTHYGLYSDVQNTAGYAGYFIGRTYISGRLGVNVITPTYAVHLPNNATNTIGIGLANAWNTYSDGRVKSNQSLLENGISTLLKIRPKTYFHHNSKFDENGLNIEESGAQTVGFIAQELYKVLPEAVEKPENDNSELWSVNYEKVIPIAVKAIQELKAEKDILSKKVEELEAKVHAYTSLEARLQHIEEQLGAAASSNPVGNSKED